MALDHLPLPYLGRQARFLLDRVVARGDRGVDRRDAAEWALSRLIELRYVEESPLDTVAFVCTAAGLRRWRVEVVADERRESEQLRRQLIRQRLDSRFSSSGVGTSTALAVMHAPAAPRYHGGLPAVVHRRSQSRTRSGWASAMAALFATATAASVIVLSSAEPSDLREWLFPSAAQANVPPPPPRAAALIDRPKADAKLASAEAAVTVPIDTHEEIVAAAVDAPAATEPETPGVATVPIASASISVDAPVQVEETSVQPAAAVAATQPPEQIAVAAAPSGPVVADTSVADRTDTGERPGGQVSTVAVAASQPPEQIAVAPAPSNPMVADTSVVDRTGAGQPAGGQVSAAAVAVSQPPEQIAVAPAPSSPVVADTLVADRTDAGEPPGGQVPAAAVAEQDTPAKQMPDVSSALVTQAMATPPLVQPEPPGAPRLIIASASEAVPAAAAVQVRPDKRVAEKTPPVDPQTAMVERLNGLSLAAARRGEEWRPSGALGNRKL